MIISAKANSRSDQEQDNEGFVEIKKKENNSILVDINGDKKNICINWLKRCIGEKTLCNHSYHARYHGEGAENMICKFHLTQEQGCWRENHRDPTKKCFRQHPPELLYFFPIENAVYLPAKLQNKNITQRPLRLKVGTCKAFMLGSVCPYGIKCSYAHGTAEMKESNIFIHNFVTGKETIPLNNILTLIHSKLYIFKDAIDRKKLENSDTRFGDVEECIPENFVKLLDKIINISRMSKECQDELTGEKHWVTNRPDIGFTDEQYDDFISLCRRFHLCEKHVKHHISLICDKKYKPKAENICNHSINCKKGCHIFEGENEICFENLCGLPCRCKSALQVQTIQEEIKKTIYAFNDELEKTKDSDEINRLSTCIEKYMKDYVDANPKIHLSQFGIKLEKNYNIQDTSHVTFDHKMIASKKFNYDDPEFNKLMKDEIEKKNIIRIQNKNVSIIQLAFRLYKFKIIKSKLSPNDNVIHHDYLSSGAYFVGLSIERFTNLQIEFNNWSNYWRSMSYHDFHVFILKKLEIWNSMGIKTFVEDDVVIETNIASEKDNYLNFWSWIRKIPIDQDITVVGTALDVVQKAYDLFLTFKTECPNFSMNFSDWISSKSDINQAVELMRKHSVMYICAKKYIDMNVISSGLTIEQFSKYNHTTVKVWMKTIFEIEQLKKYKPTTLGIDIIDIDTFIVNQESYIEYYLGGWWDYYKDDYGFDKFIADKLNGWKYVPLTNSIVPSLKIEREAKQAIKKAEEEMIQLRIKETLEEKIKEKNLKKKKLEALRALKNKKKNNKVVESDSELSSDSDSSSDSSSDSDFEFEKHKPQKLNSMMQVPCDNLYVFRNQTARGTYDIYTGPFESEGKAKLVMDSMRAWNKKASRTMRPKVVIDDNPDMKTSWNIVFGDTTNSRKNDKKETRGIIPYDWVLSLIQHLCETCLLETHSLAKFHTNIELIDYKLYEARNKPIVETKVTKKPIVETKVNNKISKKVIVLPNAETDKVKKVITTPKTVPEVKKVITTPVLPKVTNKPFLKVDNRLDDYYEDWNDFDVEEDDEEY